MDKRGVTVVIALLLVTEACVVFCGDVIRSNRQQPEEGAREAPARPLRAQTRKTAGQPGEPPRPAVEEFRSTTVWSK